MGCVAPGGKKNILLKHFYCSTMMYTCASLWNNKSALILLMHGTNMKKYIYLFFFIVQHLPGISAFSLSRHQAQYENEKTYEKTVFLCLCLMTAL
jgi:hypothetical protein